MTEQILRECETCHGAVGELGVFQHMARHAAEERDAAAREERIGQLVVRAEAAVAQLREAGVVPAEVEITLVTREEAEAMGDGIDVPADGVERTVELRGDEPAPEEDRPFSRY